MTTKYSRIISTGSYLPSKVVSNDELAKSVDTSDDWIVKRTGIKQRHMVSTSEDVASMGVIAAKRALAKGKIPAESIDLIIVASCSASHIFPATACFIQEKLNINQCIAFDVQAACSGFLYALSVANSMIISGQVKRALVIGSEAMSRVVDWEDRSTCVLFGDGSGCVLLESSESPGIIGVELRSDGKQADLLSLKNAMDAVDARDRFLKMNGNLVFKQAVKSLGDIAVEILDKYQFNADDLNWLVPHQANFRIINSSAKKIGLSLSKVILTIDKHANTSSASIPLALDVAIDSGKINRGDNILFEAFGGGLTWGAALAKF